MKIRWAHLFDWSVASVSKPLEVYHPRHRFRIVAYQVNVEYNYHGMRCERFPVGNYELFNNSQAQARDMALEFCKRMISRIRQRS